MNEISYLKDKLFIENMDKIKIIDGVIEFIRTLKSSGFACSIVTNCNRDTQINRNIRLQIMNRSC
jgi:histidinol phosphatase-like enzyme